MLQRLQDLARGGLKEACCELGKAYLEGELGLEADGGLAKQWLHRAAKQNMAQAQYLMGITYWNGAGGWAEDPSKSFKYTERVRKGGF